MSDDFYRAFEDKFRGSRELIQSRLSVYLPFIHPLKGITENARGVDLGCGRGEWLEILDREGFDATGIDLDEGMLQSCEQLKLNAHKAEAIEYLGSLPNHSVAIISAFHMVEHIPFGAPQKLAQHALRVLVPGGLLIMETPNPENLHVGAHTFYYDPTHQRPIPPLLLGFLPEHYGFARTKVLGLQQDPRLDADQAPSLMNVLTGPSPDYAVVAQKQARAHHLSQFDQAFSAMYGVTLHTLGVRYDNSRTQKIDNAHSTAQQALAQAGNAHSIAQQALAQAQEASAQAGNADSIAQQALAQAQESRAMVTHLEDALRQHQHMATLAEQRTQALFASTSWRVTAPLRWLSTALRKSLAVPLRAFRWVARSLTLAVMRWVLARPKLRHAMGSLTKRFPAVARRLHLLAIHRGLMPAPMDPDSSPPPGPLPPEPDIPLSPHGKRIYAELAKAIEQTQVGRNP